MNTLHKMASITLALLIISGQVFAVCDVEYSRVESMPRYYPAWWSADQRKASRTERESYLKTHYNDENGRLTLASELALEEGRLETLSRPDFDGGQKETHIAATQYRICMLKWKYAQIANSTPPDQLQAQQQAKEQTQQALQAQHNAQQQAQEAQLNAHQAQQQAQEHQARANQERKGKRRRHEPENVATECLTVDVDRPGFGGFVNKCYFKVWYVFCNFNPKEDSWSSSHDCVKHYGAMGSVGANGFSAAHVKNTETVYFYACKDPAWPVDDEYLPGQGIAARCHTVGGN